MNLEDIQSILAELKSLRGDIDDFYEMVNKNNYKIISDRYLCIDNQINKIQGMIMSLAISGKEN